jgi:hypothetical protein
MGTGNLVLTIVNGGLLLALGYALFQIKRSDRWQYTMEHNRRRTKIREQEEELEVLRDLASETVEYRDARNFARWSEVTVFFSDDRSQAESRLDRAVRRYTATARSLRR